MDHPSLSYRKLRWARGALLAMCAVAFSGEGYATDGDPDFYLMMKHCETSVGFLTSSDAEIKRIQPEPIHFICYRPSNKNVTCNMKLPEGSTAQKDPQIEFGVVFDVPPSLYLTNKHSADFVAIDSTKHSAVVITRLIDNEYAGSKVCHGVFVTAYEMERLLDLEGDTILHPK